MNVRHPMGIVCTSLSALGGEPPTKFSKRGGLTGPQL